MVTMDEIIAIKRKYVGQLLSLKNVREVGIGWKNGVEGDLCIVVGVTKKLPLELIDYEDVVPIEIEGFKTDVTCAEDPQLQSNIGRVRQPGYSIGNEKITAGTLGCLVKKNGNTMLLSNAHVFTPDATAEEAESTGIVQPGIYDGGKMPDDYAAFLVEYVPVVPSTEFSACPVTITIQKILNGVYRLARRSTRWKAVSVRTALNFVDAAIAVPITKFDPVVKDLWKPTGIVEAELGMKVVKTGRTTGTTRGKVTQVDVTTTIQYGGIKMAIFGEQIVIEGNTKSFSAGGDSGSIVFKELTSHDDTDHLICGLLFAGSNTITIINRIQNVFDALGISLW